MFQLVVFALAFAASAAPPGPDTLTVFSRGLQGGFRSAAPFALGVCLAKISLLTLALLGVVEFAQRFETGFVVVKFIGAAYLAIIGIRKIVQSGKVAQLPEATQERSPWQDLLVGLGLGVSNPNAVIFYVALLPSVVNVDSVNLGTYVALVAIVVALWLVVAAIYAGLADRLRSAISSPVARKRIDRLSGATMIGAGALVATR